MRILSILFLCFIAVKCDYNYTVKWFKVPLDHFGYQRNETFQIRYLINEDHWDKNNNGPIFFYTGNEGQIETFAKHTGFMWETAEEFGALIVFAEHRYYGQSMPFGNKSLEKEYVGYLTSSQALADYADLVNFLQGDVLVPRHPVIAFGGSYGGMLSAYFRIKYPHLVAGAIAASAPIHMYPDMVPCEAFNRIATSNYNISGKHCVENIKNSWGELRNFTKTTNSSEWLQKNWNLCTPVKNQSDVEALIGYLADMYVTMAMVNYPFPSDFLTPLPARPVRVACQYLNQKLSGEKLLEALGSVVTMYGNYDKSKKCIDYHETGYTNLDATGWNYQACTEMVMPSCAKGDDDMFEPSPWNYTKFSEDCHAQYGVYPKPSDARVTYGGDQLQAASNIVFSNGLMDPWVAGGIMNSVSDTIVAVMIVDGAHHLDLMPKNADDPSTVKEARRIHKTNIRRWINTYYDNYQRSHF